MTAYRSEPAASRLSTWAGNLRPGVRCHARRTDGQPCGNYAVHGLTVCRYHGGATAAARRAAADRLLRAWVEWQATLAVERRIAERQARDAEVARLLGLDREPTAGDYAAAMFLAGWARHDGPPGGGDAA